MHTHRFLMLTRVALIVAALLWGAYPSRGQNGNDGNLTSKGKVTRDRVYVEKFKRIAPSQQKAAAQRAAKAGLKPGIAGTAVGALAVQAPNPGGVPHYFGPYGNWAFSPLPKGGVGTVTVVDGGTGYSATPTVTVNDAYLPTASITPCYCHGDGYGWCHHRLHDQLCRRWVHGSRRQHH
jgi:hypothetical protein